MLTAIIIIYLIGIGTYGPLWKIDKFAFFVVWLTSIISIPIMLGKVIGDYEYKT